MKYFNNFDKFQQLNEAQGSKPSLFSRMFSSLGKGISRSFKKAKLSKLSNKYNSYLYTVYAQHVLEKQLKLEQGELTDIDTDNMVHDLSEIEIPKEENQEIEVKYDESEIRQELEEEKREEDKGDEKEDIETEVGEDDSDKDDEVVSYAHNEKGEKVNISKFRITLKELKDNVDVNEIPTVKRYLANIVTIDHMISDFIDEEEEIEEYFKEYNIRKRNTMATMRGLKPGDSKRDDIQGEVDNISVEMEHLLKNKNEVKSSIKDLESKKDDYINKIPKELGLISKMNESVDWTGGGIHRQDWTSEDKEIVTQMANPYKIEEIFLKAKNVIGDDKDSKLEEFWTEKINDVHKKWYYVFNVEELRNKRKKLFSNKKISKTPSKRIAPATVVPAIAPAVAPAVAQEPTPTPTPIPEPISVEIETSPIEQEVVFQNSVSVTQLFESIYSNSLATYSSNENYYKINSDNSEYYIFPFGYNDNMKLFLLKKQFFSEMDRKYTFKILAELDFTDTDDLVVGDLYDDRMYNRTLKHDGVEIDLYSEADDLPVIFMNRNYLYSGEIDDDNFQFLDMYMIVLYTIDEHDMDQILNNVDSNSLSRVSELSDSIIDKIKKYKL